MRFEDFAAAHGLLLRHVEFGKWIRVPTTDHPQKKNGAYKHLGSHAHVQNHATMGEVATWFPDSDEGIRVDADSVRRRCEKAARELQEWRQKAAKRAADMLRQCTLERHAYLDGKGFPDERGNVLQTDSGPLLLIPMRVAGRLVGVQTITADGEKKFLFGQQCSGAERERYGIVICEAFRKIVDNERSSGRRRERPASSPRNIPICSGVAKGTGKNLM